MIFIFSKTVTRATLTAKQSFWLSDGYEDEDADQENAFVLFFGPVSHVQPLAFNTEELQMFEQNSKDERASKLKVSISRQKPAIHSPWHESEDQFQNILDLIDEMIDGRKRNVCRDSKGLQYQLEKHLPLAGNSSHI